MEGFTDLSTTALLQALPALRVPKASAEVAQKRVLVVGGSIGGLAAAACLRAAGFQRVSVVERSQATRKGAGIAVDDASSAVLKGLGVLDRGASGEQVSLKRLRWLEERMASGKTLVRQPYPAVSALYVEVLAGLASVLPEGVVSYGRKATGHEVLQDGSARVHFDEGHSVDCDLLIAADGPRSSFKAAVEGRDMPLRFAGYFAWRGTIEMQELPSDVRDGLMRDFPDLGNCLYAITGAEPGRHAVLYNLGGGLVNWLIYESRATPRAAAGQTTAAAEPEEIAHLRSTARARWGEGLGGVIEVTADPFLNDIYDQECPLETFVAGPLAVLGDAAHAITPHLAKGSNLAIHDAFVLARAAEGAADLCEMLRRYSEARVAECRRCVLLSRHLWRLRSGLLPAGLPHDEESFDALLRSGGLAPRTLPVCQAFQPVWDFIEARLPVAAWGSSLDRSTPGRTNRAAAIAAEGDLAGPLELTAVNHISRETGNVERLRRFYHVVLGLPELPRPNFEFGGAWLQLPSGVSLHIIERDPAKHALAAGQPLQDSELSLNGSIPERYIRRSHHLAFTVPDIYAAKATLKEHDINFSTNYVPETPIVQLFFHDPDGNGIEIANFDTALNTN